MIRVRSHILISYNSLIYAFNKTFHCQFKALILILAKKIEHVRFYNISSRILAITQGESPKLLELRNRFIESSLFICILQSAHNCYHWQHFR